MAPRLIGTNSQCWLPAGQEPGKSAVRVWHSAWLKHLHCVIVMVSVWQSCAGGLPPGARGCGNSFRSVGLLNRGTFVTPRSCTSSGDGSTGGGVVGSSSSPAAHDAVTVQKSRTRTVEPIPNMCRRSNICTYPTPRSCLT